MARSPAITAPSVFNLVDNYADSARFLNAIRDLTQPKRPTWPRGFPRLATIDLSDLRSLDVSATLALAAELDRIRRVRRRSPKVQIGTLNDELLATLASLGFHRGLQDPEGSKSEGWAFVRPVTGNRTEGSQVLAFIEGVRHVVGEGPHPRLLYAGLIEALGNTCEHAYPDEASWPWRRRWWLGGAYDRNVNRLQVCALDQGVGIPATLRKNEWFRAAERARQVAAPLSAGETSADRMELALRLSSEQRGSRGNGLWTMVRLLEVPDGSSVRILSEAGQVTCSSPGTLVKAPLNPPLRGTLILWDLCFDEAT